MNVFGKRIRKLRKEYNLTQKNLADKIGVGQTTIANYENNSRFPNPEILKKFAILFDVSIDYLVGRNYDNNNSIKVLDYKDIDIDKLADTYFNLMRNGNVDEAYNLLIQLCEKNVSLKDIYYNIIEKSMIRIGELWEKNKFTVGEGHYFNELTKRLMSKVYFCYEKEYSKNINALFLCTHGERHSIGIRMISDLLEEDGWNVYFLGTDLPTESIIKMITFKKIDLIAISTTMDYNINSVKTMIRTIKNSRVNENIKFLVGGRPFNIDSTLVKYVGADSYAKSCNDIVDVANNLVFKK